ncbi:hypothetical protein SY83_19005 [Paenibacillus swuensis]|uniref:Uncharacterized protein n=1 Tax=Paenibacillus swuensis TaxID=1178515 RepID=A0A172TLU9_9BACL|nr:hypothetical protein SY83_19005 [Paenibacillus swuensis]
MFYVDEYVAQKMIEYRHKELSDIHRRRDPGYLVHLQTAFNKTNTFEFLLIPLLFLEIMQ